MLHPCLETQALTIPRQNHMNFGPDLTSQLWWAQLQSPAPPQQSLNSCCISPECIDVPENHIKYWKVQPFCSWKRPDIKADTYRILQNCHSDSFRWLTMGLFSLCPICWDSLAVLQLSLQRDVEHNFLPSGNDSHYGKWPMIVAFFYDLSIKNKCNVPRLLCQNTKKR